MRGAAFLALIAAFAFVTGCASTRARERVFPATRAGAVEAVQVMLRQPDLNAAALDLHVDASAPSHSSEYLAIQDDRDLGHVRDLFARGECYIEACPRNITSVRVVESMETGVGQRAATRFEQDTARAIDHALGSDGRLLVIEYSVRPHPNVWFWREVGTIPYIGEDLVCVDPQARCYARDQIRSVSVSEPGQIEHGYSRIEIFEPTNATLHQLAERLRARADPSVRVHMEVPQFRNYVPPVELWNVSDITDGGVCGLAVYGSAGVAEGCFEFSRITRIVVRDRTRTQGEALQDTLLAPFEVLGNAGRAIGMGGN